MSTPLNRKGAPGTPSPDSSKFAGYELEKMGAITTEQVLSLQLVWPPNTGVTHFVSVRVGVHKTDPSFLLVK